MVLQRRGTLERVGLVLADWRELRLRIVDTETQMVAVLDELGLTDLVDLDPRGVSGQRRGDPR